MTAPVHIQLHREDDVEFVTLNRPDVRNAFNEQLIGELSAWARAATADKSLRAVVISGAGPSFCAGADLVWMTKMASYTHEENLRDARDAADMFALLDSLPVPVIARVQGAALGGGSGLVAIADIAVAESEAVFGLTEVKLGLIPSIIAPYVLAKVGQSAARELFVTGRRFSAEHARHIGLVHDVVPRAELDTAIGIYLKELSTSGREAVSAAKQLLRTIANRPVADVVPITAEAIAARRTSPEAQALMRAFLDKKKRL